MEQGSQKFGLRHDKDVFQIPSRYVFSNINLTKV